MGVLIACGLHSGLSQTAGTCTQCGPCPGRDAKFVLFGTSCTKSRSRLYKSPCRLVLDFGSRKYCHKQYTSYIRSCRPPHPYLVPFHKFRLWLIPVVPLTFEVALMKVLGSYLESEVSGLVDVWGGALETALSAALRIFPSKTLILWGQYPRYGLTPRSYQPLEPKKGEPRQPYKPL